jgi:hypothetical protein
MVPPNVAAALSERFSRQGDQLYTSPVPLRD